ncbi:hypothetical protein DB313_05290 (plasmid) [Borrelia turcica IST7]|uniref:Uncharacterized protein n=1 Tax=Borrelia turcica IST7 TaxID=1104446 RepID=A0A386PPG0_9SPIR|nr:plasmid maintenance protein [Borrelia turcica]AYE36915.1 hypothetical protein DB313_05290 [Borrelia turcica IST7]
MIPQKPLFFKKTTKDKEVLLQKLIKNSQEATSHTKSVTINYVKSRIARTQTQIERSYKICWAIEVKTIEYYESGRLRHYSACDIHRMVNSILASKNSKPYASSTLRGDIKVLKELKLIEAVTKYLGDGNGGFSFYVINHKKWKDYKTIIKTHYENKLINDLANAKITGIFEEKIDSILFDEELETEIVEVENSQEGIEQIETDKLSNGGAQNSDLISKDIRSLYKYKNSKKSTLKRVEENGTDTKNRAKSNSSTKTRPKTAYNTTYEDYMEVRLESNYRVSRATMAKIRCNSNNVNTYRNALRNLEAGILVYGRDYLIGDITEHFTSEFVGEYSGKVWMMNPNTAKTNDFYKIWGRFTDKYTNKYKQQEMLSSRTYSDGYGNMSELDANGRFIERGVKPISGLLDKFRQDINKDSVI